MDRHRNSATALGHVLLDAISDVNGGAMLVVDGDDLVLYASPHLLVLFDIPEFYLAPGTRLRDFLGAIYDHCLRTTLSQTPTSRESWLSERVAAHWRERLEITDYTSKKRAVRGVMRRMSSGLGICILSDVTEQKKREENWRADLERIKVTEDILDSLPQPLLVLDEHLKIAASNKAFLAMVKRSEDALMDQPVSTVLDPSFVARLQKATDGVPDKTGYIAIAGSSDAADKPAAYLHRVGKTGRSFMVVTFTNIMSAPHGNLVLQPQPSSMLASKTANAPANHARSGGRHRPDTVVPDTVVPDTVVIVTGDSLFETTALRALQRIGTDHCVVRNQAELQAFLSLTESLGITLDLSVIDSAMPAAIADIARNRARSVVVIDRQNLGDTLARRLGPKPQPAPPMSSHEPSHPAIDPPVPDGLEILVVEDNEVNQIVFSQILEGMGCRYRLATNAAEAVSIWKSHKPPVVLLDISLPDMNGMDVCRLMRREELDGRPRCLIVGVLVPAFDHDRPRCLEAGMDDVIVKPLSPDMIEQLLRRHLSGQWPVQGPVQGPVPGPARGSVQESIEGKRSGVPPAK
ncbi:CheY-like chemotaxis protein/PAS domain-containing protein [Agrobacterium vitis]|nr:CheY-like chemotaxis protein/PAS domain-containing protein [Agrobacterium vitis]MBE1438177.1 CheY-like chemotaxis protein/PAS domain-containing protein [Agrobacterium vitis]